MKTTPTTPPKSRNLGNNDDTHGASGGSAHTPTPWSFVPEQPYFGKARNWGFIKSDAVRACVVSVGEFTKTVYGEQEHYCGVKILPQDVEFILTACNSHAQLSKRVQEGESVLKLLVERIEWFNANSADASQASWLNVSLDEARAFLSTPKSSN